MNALNQQAITLHSVIGSRERGEKMNSIAYLPINALSMYTTASKVEF